MVSVGFNAAARYHRLNTLHHSTEMCDFSCSLSNFAHFICFFSDEWMILESSIISYLNKNR